MHITIITTKVLLLLKLKYVILAERFDDMIDIVQISNRIKIDWISVQCSLVKYCTALIRMGQRLTIKLRL